jgi:hypothetical protein
VPPEEPLLPAAGVAHGSSTGGPDGCWNAPPRDAFVTFAVAHFSDGPTSSTSISMTVRFSPSFVS